MDLLLLQITGLALVELTTLPYYLLLVWRAGRGEFAAEAVGGLLAEDLSKGEGKAVDVDCADRLRIGIWLVGDRTKVKGWMGLTDVEER